MAAAAPRPRARLVVETADDAAAAVGTDPGRRSPPTSTRTAPTTVGRACSRARGDRRRDPRRGAELLPTAAETLDLLVVGSRGWGPWSRVAIGSTSDWLMHHAACPLIVVPRPADPAGEDEATLATAAHAG